MTMPLYLYEHMNVEGVVPDRCKHRWAGSPESGSAAC